MTHQKLESAMIKTQNKRKVYDKVKAKQNEINAKLKIQLNEFNAVQDEIMECEDTKETHILKQDMLEAQ